MTSVAEGLRKGRSHLIIAAALAIGGTLVVQIEDRTLNREAGKAIPKHEIAAPAALPGAVTVPMPTATVAAPTLPRAQVVPPAQPSLAQPTPVSTAAPTSPAPVGPAIQLGAFDSEAVAQERWGGLAGRVSQLAALDHRIEGVSTPRGRAYRLIAAVPDRTAARAACAAVRSAGGACFIRN